MIVDIFKQQIMIMRIRHQTFYLYETTNYIAGNHVTCHFLKKFFVMEENQEENGKYFVTRDYNYGVLPK